MSAAPAEYTYHRAPAEYAKNTVAIQCPGVDGWRSVAATILSAMPHRYSNRERAYMVSKRVADKFEAEVKLAQQRPATPPSAPNDDYHPFNPKGGMAPNGEPFCDDCWAIECRGRHRAAGVEG